MNACIVNKRDNYQVVSVTDAVILGNPGSPWRKFTGTQTDKGIRHQFSIKIDEPYVQLLKDYGLEPKWYERDGYWYLTVNISWRFGDPIVWLVSYNGVRTQMTEDMLGGLDQNGNLQFVDMDLTKSHWTYMGSEGESAYGSNIYIYLGQPSRSEQRYMERYGQYAAAPLTPTYQPELPGMPLAEEEDIPF